jgi:hypothetical protein
MIISPTNGNGILLCENISTVERIFNYISEQMLLSTEVNVLTDENRTIHWKQTSVPLEAKASTNFVACLLLISCKLGCCLW